jgi:putative hydrolase of the HAD superfamily
MSISAKERNAEFGVFGGCLKIKMLSCALFDLDNTLYPESCGLMAEIGRRMNMYMTERLGIPAGKVREIRDSLLASHGTTLNGLRRRYEINPDDFLSYVHDIPLEGFISRDESLDKMLAALPLRKIVFTNADARHARRVLSRLGVIGRFEAIIDIHLIEFCNKPDPRAYRTALEFAAVRPEECVLLEDYPVNIRTAKAMGMMTVLVGDGGKDKGNAAIADYTINSVIEFADLPEISSLRNCSKIN